jgi:GNAT superfamily N-acetyltransferase
MHRSQLERIEEAALNAWPAPRQVIYDGWLLRFASGYTKRANSINPLYPSSIPFDEKIAHCEHLYALAGLPALFRLPEPFTPDGLVPALTKAGYAAFDPTLVLGREVHVQDGGSNGVEVRQMEKDAWLCLRADLTGKSLAKWMKHGEILNTIIPRKALFGLFAKGKPLACGMGVVEGNLLGFFSVLTAPTERKKGYGRKMMHVLTNWGVREGADYGYLQVEDDNEPAKAMYTRLGFSLCYKYDYYRKN